MDNLDLHRKVSDNMERLTYWKDKEHAVLDMNAENVRFATEKLADYEDAEEQGLLLKLPCKVGDKAWYVRNSVIDEVEVDSFVLNTNLFVKVSLYVGYERYRKTLTPYKTLFFSLEEAEQALENMKSEG